MNCSTEKAVALEVLMPLITERLAAGQSVRIMPKGTSMLPMLRQGIDSVTLSALPGRLQKYDLPLYRRDDGHYVLHRIIKARESYICCGDNQFEPEQGLRHEQMIALVTAFSRGEREYSVSHPGYRLYCRLWHWSRPVRKLYRRVKRRLRRMFK